MEVNFGELGDVTLVQTKWPKKLKKRRRIVAEDGPLGYVTNFLFNVPFITWIRNLPCSIRSFRELDYVFFSALYQLVCLRLTKSELQV